MKRLGELLLEKGAIDHGELHTALQACHRTGARLGTQLLRFGFVEERALLEALSEQYGVPFVSSTLLQQASIVIRKSLPVEMLRRLQAVPFERLQGRLQVAMVNPRDPAALEELSSFAGATVEPFVGAEQSIAKALEDLRDDFMEMSAEPTRTGDVRPNQAEWAALFEVPQMTVDALLSPPRQRKASEWKGAVATFPQLTPIVGLGLSGPESLDEEGFKQRLLVVADRDELGDLLLRYAANFFRRQCLFAVHRGAVVGWMARGESVVLDDIQSLEIPLNAPSVFRDVHETGSYFVGSLPPGEANDRLRRALGEPAVVEAVMVPLMIKDRTVGFLIGDMPGEGALAVPIEDLVQAANKAGICLEVLILKNKIRA